MTRALGGGNEVFRSRSEGGMSVMDEKDWLILLGGAALGYLMSVAANFTTVPIGYAAGEFRSRLIERSKKRASTADLLPGIPSS